MVKTKTKLFIKWNFVVRWEWVGVCVCSYASMPISFQFWWNYREWLFVLRSYLFSWFICFVVNWQNSLCPFNYKHWIKGGCINLMCLVHNDTNTNTQTRGNISSNVCLCVLNALLGRCVCVCDEPFKSFYKHSQQTEKCERAECGEKHLLFLCVSVHCSLIIYFANRTVRLLCSLLCLFFTFNSISQMPSHNS